MGKGRGGIETHAWHVNGEELGVIVGIQID